MGFAGASGSRGGASSLSPRLADRLDVVFNGRCHWYVYLDVDHACIEGEERRDCSSSLRVTDAMMLLEMSDGVVRLFAELARRCPCHEPIEVVAVRPPPTSLLTGF